MGLIFLSWPANLAAPGPSCVSPVSGAAAGDAATAAVSISTSVRGTA